MVCCRWILSIQFCSSMKIIHSKISTTYNLPTFDAIFYKSIDCVAVLLYWCLTSFFAASSALYIYKRWPPHQNKVRFTCETNLRINSFKRYFTKFSDFLMEKIEIISSKWNRLHQKEAAEKIQSVVFSKHELIVYINRLYECKWFLFMFVCLCQCMRNVKIPFSWFI